MRQVVNRYPGNIRTNFDFRLTGIPTDIYWLEKLYKTETQILRVHISLWQRLAGQLLDIKSFRQVSYETG